MARRRSGALFAVVMGTLAAGTWPTPAAEPEVLDKAVHSAAGTRVELVAGPPSVRYPMFTCLDDRGRLYVAESSGNDLYRELKDQSRNCRILRLEDRTGDGNFDHVAVFADRLVYPMGLAWRGGRLYVADPPKVVALSDTTGDGRADRREVILGDFGHLDNGSLHGLAFGPDGRLYMTMGTPDGFDLKEGGRSVATGGSGALIRCRPDGSEPEVLGRGFENLIEVAWTPAGEVIGTNNWYQKPVGGVRDSLLHLVPGGIYPRHPTDGTPHFPRTGPPLPAIDLFAAVAISGLEHSRRADDPTGLTFFSAQFNTRKVARHRLARDGSTFSATHEDYVWSDGPFFRPSDVLEDADGSLLVIDTGLWYVQHCATGSERRVAGGIYRLRPEGADRVVDPRGRAIEWGRLAVAELDRLLDDARPAVVDRAVEELVARGRDAAEVITRHVHERPGLPRIWVLARIGGPGALASLRGLLSVDDPDVVAAAARALGSARDRDARQALEAIARSATRPAHVRLAAAEALAECGSRDSLPALWQGLTAGPPDRMLEHALAWVIGRRATADDLDAAFAVADGAAKAVALRLLDQPPHERLTRRQLFDALTDDAGVVRAAALESLRGHPEWAAEGVGLIEGWLSRPDRPSVETLESLILAFQAEVEVQKLTARVLTGRVEGFDDAARLALIRTLRQTTLAESPDVWRDAVVELLGSATGERLDEAIRTAVALRLPDVGDRLARIARNPELPTPTRLEALGGLARTDARLADDHRAFLVAALAEDNPMVRLGAAEVLARSRLGREDLLELLEKSPDDPLIWPALLSVFADSSDETVGLRLVARLGQLVDAGAWPIEQSRLDSLLAGYPPAVREQSEGLNRRLAERAGRARDRLRAYLPLLSGGDARRGRDVFAGRDAGCLACHRVGGSGGLVGPDLSRIGAVRSPPDLLEGVVLPSAGFAQGYQTYVVTTFDGRVYTGIIARERSDQEVDWNPSDGLLVLRDSAGKEHRFRHDEIDSLERSPVSIMPEGLLEKLSEGQTRDLFAYLRSLE